MIYDGQLLGGSIIGSVEPRGLNQKTPDYWAKETDMLFYERIDMLNLERLRSTVELIKSSVDIIAGNNSREIGWCSATRPHNPSQTRN